MDNNQKKIMPGCEKLTRPEEITALRDYLRQGIQENEESLVIGDENPVLKTPGSPILGKVDLDHRKLVLINGTNVEIDSKKINLEVPGNITPGDYLDRLEDNRKITLNETLSPDSLKIKSGSVDPKEYSATIKGNTMEPTKDIKEISENNINPENKIHQISENNQDPKSKIIGLEKGQEVSIDEYREPLSNSDNISSLSYFLSQLDVPEDPEVREDRISLSDTVKDDPYDFRFNVLENNVDPDSKVLEILENKVNVEESLLTIKAPEILPGEKKLEIEENLQIPEELRKDIQENDIDPTTKIHRIKRSDETITEKIVPIGKSDHESWIGDNNAGFTSSETGKVYPGKNGITEEELVNFQSQSLIESSKNKDWIGDNNAGHVNPITGKLYPGSDGISKEELTAFQSRSSIESSKNENWPGDNYARGVNPTTGIMYHGDLGTDANEELIESELDNFKAEKIPLLEKPLDWPKLGSKEEMEYLNLKEAEYETYLQLKTTAEQLYNTPSGNWAKRLMSYLQAILSRTEKWRKTINSNDKLALDSILSKIKEDNLVQNKSVELPDDKALLPKHSSIVNSSISEIKNSNNIFEAIGNIKDNASSILTGSLRDLAEGTADLTSSFIKDSSVKQDILDSALYTLVSARNYLRSSSDLSSLDPGRLPGQSPQLDFLGTKYEALGAILSGDIKGSLDKLLDHGTKAEPKNRPLVDPNTGRTNQWKWDNGAGRPVLLSDYLGTTKSEIIESGSLYKVVNEETGNIEEVSYNTNFKFAGVRTTLEDLCPRLSDKATIGSLEDLKDLLDQSPYITTSSKVNKNRVMTLDSNHVWELRLFPYLGDLNGNCSWLPSIAEINSINYTDHGVRTRWGDWIPVNSFELQSKKMTQKTLGLFDGEISYPISMEFSNELRLTIIDDQYKSWKRYFELCAECSTYLTKMVNYVGHKVNVLNDRGEIDIARVGNMVGTGKDYTALNEDDLLSYSETTPIVKGTVCPGMYKNLAFRCLIYVMTPQMSTIQKFDLLVVLKDYSIEYTGEPDASSPDLNVSFSIVGENPDEAIAETLGIYKPNSGESIMERLTGNTIFKNKSAGETFTDTVQNIVSAGINILK